MDLKWSLFVNPFVGSQPYFDTHCVPCMRYFIIHKDEQCALYSQKKVVKCIYGFRNGEGPRDGFTFYTVIE